MPRHCQLNLQKSVETLENSVVGFLINTLSLICFVKTVICGFLKCCVLSYLKSVCAGDDRRELSAGCCFIFNERQETGVNFLI